MLGLSNGNANASYTDIDFALYLYGSQLMVYEAGFYRASLGPFATGDTLRVEVDDGTVHYSRNGTALYSSTTSATYPLLVDSALYSTNATLVDVVISGAE
jgi:hypothetical protein